MTSSVTRASSVSGSPAGFPASRWAQAGRRLACQRPSVSVRPWFRPSCEESLRLNQGLRKAIHLLARVVEAERRPAGGTDSKAEAAFAPETAHLLAAAFENAWKSLTAR